MSFTQRPGSECPRQTSRREDCHIVRNARVQVTASLAAIQVQVAPSLGAPVSFRTIGRHLAEGHFGITTPITCCFSSSWVLGLAVSQQVADSILYSNVFLARSVELKIREQEWNQVVFSDKSRFNLSSDDNRVRVWRPCGECLNPTFALQQHTAPTAGVMVWDAVVYNTRSTLILIPPCQPSDMSMTSCNHMCCHSFNGSKEPFFNKTMLGLTRQGCHKTVSTLLLHFLGLPDSQICIQSSISEIIWDGELDIPRV
ncbi:transposable element Tcb2 transposase [Trichonephila clavipes]|nr:transposable element Tcb2 transposase [Trichonephila clavipes]